MPPTQKLDRNSQRPLYDQLGEVISKEIDRGLRKEGDRIPSVRQLAETYSVSLFTAHRTITNLVSQGMLQPERGRGTFVASTRPRNTTPAKAARTIAFRPSYSLKTMEDSAFFSRLLHGLFEATSRAERDFLCITPKTGGPGPHPTPVSQIDPNAMSGVVALSYNTNDLLALNELNLPVVVADYDMSYAGLDSVVFDNQSASKELAELLVEAGCQRIAYVGFGRLQEGRRYEIADPAVWDRYAGLKQAIAIHGLREFTNQFLVMDHVLDNEAERIAKVIANSQPRPDGLIAFDDSMAVNIGRELARKGIEPGHDIRIAGFGCTVDPTREQRYLSANVKTDERAMADKCVGALLQRIDHPSADTVKQVVPMEVRPATKKNNDHKG